MKALNNYSVFLATAVVAVVGVANAAQPPNVVSSDGSGNTAMGTNALLHNGWIILRCSTKRRLGR